MSRSSAVALTAVLYAVIFGVIAVPKAVLAQGIRDQTGTAKIAGQVTRSDNGKPITNAVAQLLPAGISAAGKRVKVDAQGRFEITDLAAGQYLLNVSADGYINLDAMVTRPNGSGRLILLKDGEVVANANVAMAPTSSIDGRVLDEFGDPAPGITVQIAQLMRAVGRTRMMPLSIRSVQTDDRGQFRFAGLSSGDFYLVALSGPFGTQGAAMLSSPLDDRTGFAPTYFPGTPTASEAKPVHLDVGMNAANTTFALTPAKLATISGVLVDTADRPVGPAIVQMLATQGGDVRAFIPANVSVAPDGTFHVRNVPAGTYVLQGRTQTGFGALPVSVDGTEQSNLKIVVHPSTTARGHISFDGDGPLPLKNEVGVALRPTDMVSGPAGGNRMPSSQVSDDFTFELPGLQSIGVMGGNARPPWRLKSVTIDGKNIADVPYNFRLADATNIEVVFTSRVGSLTGTVVDGDASVGGCSVILFPEDKAAWAYPSRLVALSPSNANGAISIGAILPGRYFVVAVPAVQVVEIDPADLESLRSLATPVTIEDGKAATVALKLVKR